MRPISVRTMLWRGARRRCARCGATGVFRSYFKLHERCPSCGYRFERESGFWMGVYLINYAATAVVLVLFIFGYIWWLDRNDEGGSLLPVILIAEGIAIAMPLLTYRTAKTLWAAIDLASHPLDPVDEAEAALHRQPQS